MQVSNSTTTHTPQTLYTKEIDRINQQPTTKIEENKSGFKMDKYKNLKSAEAGLKDFINLMGA